MRTLLCILALAAVPVSADEAGEALYMSYCASCHGASATGDGPMAALLSVPVADLTTLAARNQGMFPLVPVVQLVDGRRTLRGHGGPMPVFGPILGGGSAALDGPDGSIIETRGDIVSIVTHLMELQR